MFPKNSFFHQSSRGGYPGSTPTTIPIPPRSRGASVNEGSHTVEVNAQDVESWYHTLNELCQVLDIPRDHVVSSVSIAPLHEEVERLRDQMYRYLRG